MKKTARAHVQGQIASGASWGTVHQLFPIVKPLWDLNDAGNYAMSTRYREPVKFELKHAIAKAINWSVLYYVKEGWHKSLTDFADRLQAALCKYTAQIPHLIWESSG